MAILTSGLERWLREGPSCAGLTPGVRIGLVTHPCSVDREARHAVALLAEAPHTRLERLFAPEHGLWGHEQDMERVPDATDPGSGIPVVSLYGADESSLRPKRSDLEGLDAVLIDLQDVGSRYYTFVYTLSYVMETAAEIDLPVVVLDRPNPIDGRSVEGPLLAPELASFVGRYSIPVRHGMTIGELGLLFHGAFGVGDLPRVVEMQGWDRARGFEATGLPWVPPSPNMPSLSTARVYPGGCLVEGTNLSEGRGTTLPFEWIGAPWLDAHGLADTLRARALPGVVFRAGSFRPMFQKHAGLACHGVQIIVRDVAAFRPFRTYLELLSAARAQRPDEFDWRREAYEFETRRLAIDLLLGRHDLRPKIEAGLPVERIVASFADEPTGFLEDRRPYLRY